MAISFAGVRVLDPPRVARRLLWHVLSIGVVWRDEPEDHAGMDKAGLFLFQVKSGAGTLELPDRHHALERGHTWWLVDLAQPRRYVPAAGASLVTMGVRFSGPAVEAWREEGFAGRAGLAIAGRVHAASLHRAARRLSRLATSSSSDAPWRTHEQVTQILGVVLEATQVLARREPAVNSPVRRVIEAVQANPQRDWRAAELAAVAQTGYSSLREHFKRTQGETLHDFVRRLRLEQARMRLSDLRMSVKEVSSQLHFSSEFYFSRWFREGAGMSPSQFRALLRG